MELAKIITFRLKEEDEIQKVEIKKPGFLNFFFMTLFGKTN